MDEADLPAPSFYKYPSHPQLIDAGIKPSALLALATTPAYINARNDATADIVLFVLTNVNAPEGDGCGAAARSVPAKG